MSWSISLTQRSLDALEEALREGKEPATLYNQDAADTYDAAAAAVLGLIRSGTLGGATGDNEWQVSMGGHGNPGHAPRDGYAPDGVNINITQRKRAPAPAEETTEEATEPSS